MIRCGGVRGRGRGWCKIHVCVMTLCYQEVKHNVVCGNGRVWEGMLSI